MLDSGDERTYVVNEILYIQYLCVDGKAKLSVKINSNAEMLSSMIHELHFIHDMFISGQVKLGQHTFTLRNITK